MDIRIETPRLRIRPIEITDAQDMFDLNSDLEVVRYTGDTAFDNLADAANIVRYVQAQYAQHGMGRWAVELRETGALVGWSGLKYHPDVQEVDLGYRFFRKYWGQGIGQEAAAACFDYGRNTLGITRIVGRAVAENMGSVRILQNLGFVYERDEIEDGLVFGVYVWKQ
jgi:[ribosomal protein S5]-alanine N-acetyltransferase